MILNTLRLILLGIILLIVTSLALMQVKGVKLYLFAKVAALVEENSGVMVSVDDLELMLPFEVKAAHLRIVDEEGNRLEACRAVIRFAPSALFNRELFIHSINLTGVDLFQSEEGLSSNGGGSPLDILRFPFFVSIPQIYLNDISIISPLFPALTGVVLDGKASLLIDPEKKKVDTTFSLSERGGQKQLLEGSLFLGEKGESLFVDGKLRGKGGAFFALPEAMDFNGAARLTACRKTWESFFSNKATDERIVGELSLQAEVEKQGAFQLKSSLYITPETLVEFDDLEGVLFGQKVKGRILYDGNERFDGTEVTVTSTDLSYFNEWAATDLAGKGFLRAKVSGNISEPKFHLVFSSDQMRVQQAAFSPVEIELEGGGTSESGFVATIAIEANEVEKGPFSINSKLHYRGDGELELGDFSLHLPYMRARGGLLYSFSNGSIAGSIEGKSDDLALFNKFFYTTLSGSAAFDATITHDEEKKHSIDISLSSESSAIDNLAIEGMKAEVTVTDIFNHPDGFVDLTAKKVASHGVEWQNLSLSNHIEAEKSAWPLTIAFEGKEFFANGGGYWSLLEEGFTFTIDELAGEKGKNGFRLEAPFTITRDQKGSRVTPLLLAVEGGQLDATLAFDDNGAIETTLKLVDLPLSLFTNELYSQPLGGIVTATIDISGRGEQLLGEAYFDLRDLTFGLEDHLQGASPTSASIKAELSPNKSTFQGMLYSPGGTPIVLEASLPITLTPTAPLLHVDYGGDMALSLKASGSITPLFELAAAEDIIFSGEGEIEIDLKGPLVSPTVSGSAALTNGSLESYLFGTYLSDIKASFRGEGNRLLITNLSARDQANGRLEGSGEVTLFAEKGYPFSIEFTLNDLELLRLDNGAATFEGNLTISGSKEGIEVGGEIVANKMNYRIAQKIEEVRETVEVTYINQDPDVPPPTELNKKLEIPLPTKLDLLIKIPQNVLKVTDEGLSSSWGGELSLKGPIDKPRVKGEIKLNSGEYFLNGQPYDLTNGNITMKGSFDKKTTIYVVATREINDYRVEVIVQGKVANPNIILRSTPPLPQQEILSLILFGASPAEITHTQDQQLERSLSSLTKNKGGSGAFNKIQKSVGIDRIDIHRHQMENREELSIKIGKYLTKNIFISLNKGLGNEPTRIGLEAKLRRNLKVQVDAGESPRSSDSRTSGQVSLIWKHDY